MSQEGNNKAGLLTVTRTRGLDAIPFTRPLKVDMAIWHWTATRLTFAAATHWYARPGEKWERVLPVAKPGRYELRLQLTRARDSGRFQFWLHGGKLGEPVDLFHRAVDTVLVNVGTQEWSAGDHMLTAEVVGSNATAELRHMLGFGLRGAATGERSVRHKVAMCSLNLAGPCPPRFCLTGYSTLLLACLGPWLAGAPAVEAAYGEQRVTFRQPGGTPFINQTKPRDTLIESNDWTANFNVVDLLGSQTP